MDKISLDFKNKRVHAINISQAMNVKKMIDDFVSEVLPDKEIKKLYIGFDNDYFNTIGFDIKFNDVFQGELVTPIDLRYNLITELPDCDVLFVYCDTYIDGNITDYILHNVSLKTHIIYIFDSLVTDYSDGEFYKRYINADSIIQTFNRRPDIKPSINTLLNKLKKYNIRYINDPELQSEDYEITFEQAKDDELLDYDKIILVNTENVSEYNIRCRTALARNFLPEARDRMINYTPIQTKIPNEVTGEYDDLYIPIYSELIVLEMVTEPKPLVPPIYRFKYIDHNDNEIEFQIPINLGFIDDMNDNTVDKEGTPMSFSGYKLYFAYAIPLHAVVKRYDNVLLVVEDSLLNKSVIYTAVRYAKQHFKLTYQTNVYIG